MTDHFRGTIGGIVALVILAKVAKKIVGGTAKVVRSTTKVVAKKRKAAPRKKRGVTLGQVIALPVVAIASVLFGSRKRRRKSILDNDPRWVEPGSTWRDPSERFKF